jgi:predicted ArsR family transcriptional regulator
MNRQEKDKQILKELVDKMFEIAGHDLKFEDVEGRTDEWYQQYTMTEEQNKEWREWGVKRLKKMRRYNTYLAEREMAWLDLYCGLKISDSK